MPSLCSNTIDSTVRRSTHFICFTSVVSFLLTGVCFGQVLALEQIDFFESHIRPVLIESCYECHNSRDTAEAELAVDFRDGLRKPTEHGTAVVPGDVEQSLLLKVVRHEIEGLEMPSGGAKLSDAAIANFEQWIRIGASDPRDKPPTADELAVATSWPETLKQRKQWWSFQPIRTPPVPSSSIDSSNHPIDRFIAVRLHDAGLAAAKPADKRTLIRRLSYSLIGLPPTPAQIDAFIEDTSEEAFATLVDQMLNSAHFGEQWALHWMDLVRYADSHGSEGDPTIPHAYRYRDYLIRAFNDDVPYDRLIREHIAGDLLADPRINDELQINESQIGPAHLRFVFHGFAPTDPLDEKVRFTDDQINVISKAFLGLTVSCARCHNHKFDAISQADYYAMFGVLGSCRPALVDVNTPNRKDLHKRRLSELKQQIRTLVGKQWQHDITSTGFPFGSDPDVDPELLRERFADSPLMKPILDITTQIAEGLSFNDAWQKQRIQWDAEQQSLVDDAEIENARKWDLAQSSDYSQWFPDGNGLSAAPTKTGDVAINVAVDVAGGGDGNIVAKDKNAVISAIFPAGVFSHGLSTKHRGFLGSPRFRLDDEYNIWLRIQGNNKSTVRYVVQNYPRNGTVYPIPEINDNRWYWQHLNVDYWQGDDIHLELATAQDAPLQIHNNDRSWFGVRQIIVRKKGLPAPPANEREFLQPVFAVAKRVGPNSIAELYECYRTAISDAISAWQAKTLTDAQALLLNECLGSELLGNTTEHIEHVAPLLDEFRILESEIPLPTRVPGVVEADAFDQPLFERGNHRLPLEPVRRRFLEAIDDAPYNVRDSGRLALANDLVRPDNPLTTRVATNRIWHYLFGRGIVDTPDNFGRLGSQPTHPELLDFLAHRFQQDGWSIKKQIRFIVLSKTWQQSSDVSEAASKRDPTNQWLSHANVQRLDAESLRDTLFAVAGKLDRAQFGPGFSANSASPRRAIYVTSQRNDLDPFLTAFDAPVPFATTGRRSVTNVPAQSLMLLNDPFVMTLAGEWADQVGNDDLSDHARAAQMFASAFGRSATTMETQSLVDYVSIIRSEQGARSAWTLLAHALFNAKEFIYIR